MSAATAIQRAPHRATRALVEADGTPAAQGLYDAFERYNRELFAGQLEQAMILIIETTSRRSWGDYCPKDQQGLQSRIRLAPRTLASPLGPRHVLDVLLHEMIHAWQTEIDGDTEEGYRGHGPRFAAKCNEIGARMTPPLPEVAEKGRHGKPDCAHWPGNVRPAGYYDAEWQAPTRKPGKDKAPADAGANGGGDEVEPEELPTTRGEAAS